MNLDEKNVRAYYDAHLSDYVQEEYRLQHVFISSRRGDAAERAQEARRELEQGKPFEKVAAEFSDEAWRRPGRRRLYEKGGAYPRAARGSRPPYAGQLQQCHPHALRLPSSSS